MGMREYLLADGSNPEGLGYPRRTLRPEELYRYRGIAPDPLNFPCFFTALRHSSASHTVRTRPPRDPGPPLRAGADS